jgi:hypothetical protein
MKNKKTGDTAKTEGEKEGKADVPKGINSIAILNYIAAGLLILFGTIIVYAGILVALNPNDFVKAMSESMANNPALEGGQISMDQIGQFAGVFKVAAIVLGIVMIGLAILLIIVGIKMRKLKKWAKTAEVVLCAIFILFILFIFGKSSAFGIFLNLILLAMSIWIIVYLTTNNNVKKAFS